MVDGAVISAEAPGLDTVRRPSLAALGDGKVGGAWREVESASASTPHSPRGLLYHVKEAQRHNGTTGQRRAK